MGRAIWFFSFVWAAFSGFPVHGEDWPEWRGSGREGLWRETGLIEKFEGGKIDWEWSAPIGPGYNGPTVAGDRVYVMDRGPNGGDEERVLCFDRRTGEEMWVHEYPCEYMDVSYPLGPRASVTIKEGRCYSLGTMGHFFCLDAETGEVIWSKDFEKEYRINIPVWGMTCSPLVEGNTLIVQVGGADGACVVGLEKETGDEVWRVFDDKASYVSPVVIDQAGKRVVVVWTGFRIAGLDPGTGEVFWEHATRPRKMPINVPGPARSADGSLMFLSTFYDGSRMLRIDQEKLEVEELWLRRGVSETKTDALHNMISPPYIRDGHVYGVDSYGQLRCLKADTGDRVWESVGEAVPQGRWSTIFMVRNGDRTWMLNELGELIIAELTPSGYREISRAKLIEPTTPLRRRGLGCLANRRTRNGELLSR